MDAPPHLFTFLTRNEFKLCFAVAFVTAAVFADSYPLDRYATPGDQDPDYSWEELIRRAVRYLGLSCGFEFEALTPHDDGRITSGHQIQPENMAFVRILRDGSLPDVEHALKTAIEIVEAQEVRGKIPLEPLREGLSIVRSHLQAVRRQVNPEALGEVVRMRRDTLDELLNRVTMEVN